LSRDGYYGASCQRFIPLNRISKNKAFGYVAMSQDSTESTAPLAGISWKGVPSTPVDERMSQAIAGDRASIEALFAAHHAGVYRICCRMMGNREDAHDTE
jgi:hypothetical protein